MKIYSKINNTFYAPELEPNYRASGTWPADGIEVSSELHAQIFEQLGSGKMLGVDASGKPCAIDAPAPSMEELATAYRRKRDYLLSDTDWTQGSDVPESTRTKYTVYRQVLRDIPQQAGFPVAIQWPMKP